MKTVNELKNGNKDTIYRFGGWGWLTIIFCMAMFWFFVGMVNDGTNYFAPAVAENIGVNVSVILGCNSTAGIIGVFIYIIMGQVNKNIGATKTAALNVIIAAIGYFIAANTSSLIIYMIATCFVVGGIMTAGYISGGTWVASWFPKKKGVIMGYTTMGHNLSSATYVPLIMFLIKGMGVKVGVIPICIACFLLGILILIFQKNTPFERNMNPDNVSDKVYEEEYDTGDDNNIEEHGGWTVKKLLKTKELWMAAIATGGFQICSGGVMQQLVARNIELGFTENAAITIMSILALGGVVGSGVIGIIDDKIGTKKTMIGFGIWYALALVSNFTGNIFLVYVSLFMIAMGIGGSANFMTSLPTSIFGRQGFDVVNSVCFPIQGAVTSLNFLINSIVLTMTGNVLRYTYLVFTVIALGVAVLVSRIDEHKYNRDWKVAEEAKLKLQ